MKQLKLFAAVLAIILANVHGRPQEDLPLDETALEDIVVVVEGTTKDPFTLEEIRKTGENLLEEVRQTTETIGDGLRQLFSDLWTTSAQVLLSMNTSFRESAVDTLEGVQDAIGATDKFVRDSIRRGGKLASDAMTVSLNVSRDAVDTTSQFVNGVGNTALQGFRNTANAATNYIDESERNFQEFSNAANEVTKNVVVGSIDNFTDQ